MKLSHLRENIEKTYKWGLNSVSEEIRKTADVLTPAEFYALRMIIDIETDIDYRFEDFNDFLVRRNIVLDDEVSCAIDDIKNDHRSTVNAILTDPEYDWDELGEPEDVSFRIDEVVETLKTEIIEVEAGFSGLLGCYIICPKCKTMRAFTNTLPQEIEECIKCGQKMKIIFGGLCEE